MNLQNRKQTFFHACDIRSPAYKAGATSGFTLLELLIAVTLMAVTLGIATGGFHLSIRTWEAGGERLEQRGEITESINLIRSYIKTAKSVSYFANEDRNVTGKMFIGEENLLTFVTASPRLLPSASSAGLYIQRVEFDTAGKTLFFKEARFDPSKKPDEYDWMKMAMAEGNIKNFRFEYFVKNSEADVNDENSEKFIWVDSVNSGIEVNEKNIESGSVTFPRAVRIFIEVANAPDGFAWPSQLIPLYYDSVIEKAKR